MSPPRQCYESGKPRGRMIRELELDLEDGSCPFGAGNELFECASDFVNGLFQEAIEDHSDEAVFLIERSCSKEAYLVHDMPVPTIPEENSEFMEALLAEEEAMALEESCNFPSLTATTSAEKESSSDSEAVDAASMCSDYPDSELVEDVDASRQPEQTHQAVMLDYVIDMFEAAFSGNIQELFGPGILPEDDHPVKEVTTQLPVAASLLPCSRPSFRKRFRPYEVPPPAEEFPMDCLPSAPVCLSAPATRSLDSWAAQAQCAALAEQVLDQVCITVCHKVSETNKPASRSSNQERLAAEAHCAALARQVLEQVCQKVCKQVSEQSKSAPSRSSIPRQLPAEAPLDDSFIFEEVFSAPLPPTSPKPQKPDGKAACRPRPCFKGTRDVQVTVPREGQFPAGSSSMMQWTYNEIERLRSGKDSSVAMLSYPSASSWTVPTPPDAPPPCKSGRPQPSTSAFVDKAIRTVVKDTKLNPIKSPRARSKMRICTEVPPANPEVFAVAKSAMSMDLGDEVAGTATSHASLPSPRRGSSIATKTSGMLPPILQTTWVGV